VEPLPVVAVEPLPVVAVAPLPVVAVEPFPVVADDPELPQAVSSRTPVRPARASHLLPKPDATDM